MTQSIKSVETKYNGQTFRSRLEARWAVFFDHMRLQWQYEPALPVPPGWKSYRPDFLIEQPQSPECRHCLRLEAEGRSFDRWTEETNPHCFCTYGYAAWVEIKPHGQTTDSFRAMLADLSDSLSWHAARRKKTPAICILLIQGSPSDWTGTIFNTGITHALDKNDPMFGTFEDLWSPRALESGEFADGFRFW